MHALSWLIALLIAFVFLLGFWMGRRRSRRTAVADNPSDAIHSLLMERTSLQEANQELQRTVEELELAAGTDRLTGTWNRRRFEEGAASHMALASRTRDALSLVLFDVDRFKRVNDTYGHLAGDTALVSITGAVQLLLRTSDALIRWGGEEFIVLLPNTNLGGSLTLAEKMRETIEGLQLPTVGQATISLGIAQFHPGESLESWVTRADQALYRAKRLGRNRVELALDHRLESLPESTSILELVWSSQLESGHPLLDAQHRELFDLSNALLASLTQGRQPSESHARFQLVLDHVRQHFQDEERVMKQLEYPEWAVHAVDHARLLNQASVLERRFGKGDIDFAVLLNFLAMDLVKGHLLERDAKYFDLFRNSLLPAAQ